MPKPPQIGDIVRIKGDNDLWKIIAKTRTTTTATSLRAYPRIDTTVPNDRITTTHQE